VEIEIYRFSAEVCDYKDDASTKTLLGGKGAGLVVMAQAGMPVPPGFTIPTTVCKAYMALSPDLRETMLDGLMNNVLHYMSWLESKFGYRPLVSVRSGAPISMPGMMDTILNVGLCNDNFKEWRERIGSRATFDCDRRLTQMLGHTGYGVPMEVFDFQLAKVKKQLGAKSDTDLDTMGLSHVILAFRQAFEKSVGHKFPFDDWQMQLRVAIKAVFDSWNSERAIEYRKINKISNDMGTAVTVQAMVFGNMGEDSGTGVLFSREPSTGEKYMMGEFLVNAQGEDVVAGIRTPMSIERMNHSLAAPEIPHQDMWAGIFHQLLHVCDKLETVYKDMVDVEFTVQKGELFILQSRSGKRSARAAFRIAAEMVAEGVIPRTQAMTRLSREQYKVVCRPMIDPAFKIEANLTGLPACPGVVTGRPVFCSADAVAATDPVILVTHETSPNDIAGMAKAVGILTQTGGATSHAAVVARAMDKACVVGATSLNLETLKASMNPGSVVSGKFAKVTIDGATGRVWFNVDVPVIDASADASVRQVIDWCYELTGACENVPVDIGTVRPHRIVAAEWWGSPQVLNAVLTGLAALPIRSHIVLDLTPPRAHAHADDSTLLGAFGDTTLDQGFDDAVVAHLAKFASKLGGLKLIGEIDDVASAEGLGFTVLSKSAAPEALPADYVALSVLG
jgi:pyruvate,orthophosphate dikinase